MASIPHPGLAEDAVRETLKAWLSSILADVERENGRAPGLTERPHAWVRTADPLQIKIHALPTVAIVGQGLIEDPEWDVDDYGTWWSVAVTVYARGRNADESLDNVRLLTAAARQALLSKPSLGGVATAVRWLDEDFDVLEATKERTLTGGDTVFAVLITGDSYGTGPSEPDPPDEFPEHPETPTADTVAITVEQIEET